MRLVLIARQPGYALSARSVLIMGWISADRRYGKADVGYSWPCSPVRAAARQVQQSAAHSSFALTAILHSINALFTAVTNLPLSLGARFIIEVAALPTRQSPHCNWRTLRTRRAYPHAIRPPTNLDLLVADLLRNRVSLALHCCAPCKPTSFPTARPSHQFMVNGARIATCE